jgi:CRISPR-associated protein Cas2
MMVLITYDVATTTQAGRRRLTHVAKACLDFGTRVQNSVFECKLDPAQWARLKSRLLETYDPAEDSLRFYYLGANYARRIEHHGAKPTQSPDDPMIV